MGVGSSKEEEARLASAIRKLSKVEIQRIEDVFHELSYVSGDGKRLIKRPTWLDREQFAVKFGLPDFLGEQLFAAFDRDQNEVVDMSEFLAGIALCLHGNIKDKCKLLFKIFNLDGDEGIKRDELTTVLTSSLQSAHGVLTGYLEDEMKGTVGWQMKITETVERIVNDAFETCDTSRNGRLEIEEFEHWVHKNAKLINSIFLISCPKPSENPSHYDVIPSPLEEGDKVPLKKESQGSSEKDNRKHLNDLFGSEPSNTRDTAGQSFFDTIGGPTENIGVSLQQGIVNEPILLSSSKEKTVPSTEIEKESMTVSFNEPDVPVNAEDILQHHLHTTLLDDKMCSRNSEMSLVSLTQSTGDLSSLDESVDQVGLEKDLEVDETLEQSGMEIKDKVATKDKDKPIVDNGADLIENQARENLVLDVGTRNNETGDGLSKDRFPQGGLSSPWHPLKPDVIATVEGNQEEDLFLDTSDLIQTKKDSRIPETKSGNEIQTDETRLVKEGDLQSESSSSVNLQSDVDPSISVSMTNTSRISNEKSVIKVETENSFEEIPETVVEESTSMRPSSLDVEEVNSINSADLSPHDFAVGKPTLRQLAEMKEFDRSPSLEDTNSALPEARLAAWLPSEETRLVIEAVNRGVSADRNQLANPSVLLETSLGDPVKDLVCKYLGEQEASKRPVPAPDSIPMNDAGLKSLLASQCWRGGVDWTAKYLTAHGQGLATGSPTGASTHTPKLLQIWFVRIALLFKLKSFSNAEAELKAFEDFEKPDLFYEYYPKVYPGMKGSLVPFSLRVIHAELPQHNGRPQETLDRLYRLLSTIRSVLKNLLQGLSEFGETIDLKEDVKFGAIQLWQAREIRILYGIGNCLLSIKEYALAMKILSEIIKKEPENKPAILSAVGRLYLQLGDIPLAKKYFKKVEKISLGDPKTLTISVMNRGFVASAEGKYAEAFENFLSVTKLDPENSSAWNNASVSLVFQGKVKEACTLLEKLIWKSPKMNLHEDIIFNLCTIYELETSRALQKKQKLLDLVCRHRGDGFNVQSLKLT